MGVPGAAPRLLLTSAAAVLQRVPPPGAWAGAALRLAVGDGVELEGLRAALGERGYHHGEAVTEAGEAALRGHVVDIFPAASAFPVRMELDAGRITTLRRFDPVSQRSEGALEAVVVHPAMEFPLNPAEAEHALEVEEPLVARPSGRLVPVFDYLGGFAVVLDEGLEEQWAALREQAVDAYEASRRLRRVGAEVGVLPRPDRLFLTPGQVAEGCAGALTSVVETEEEATPRRVSALLRRAREVAGPVVIATPGDAGQLAHSLERRGLEARAAADWGGAVSGGVACLTLDIEEGFRTANVTVLQAGGLVRADGGARGLMEGDGAPRVGDVVVYAEHGAARLVGLKAVGEEERLALAFADGSELLVLPGEMDRVWRYGTEGSLDRIQGEAWRSKRAAIEAEIAGTAERLAEAAAARAGRVAPVMEPDRAPYERLARRFPYALSSDQQRAVDAVLADLRRGSPMDRLVCGDVGFGKTEVALRAAAAAALCGHQVAVAAPTTVLARQHLETFRQRFEGSGLRIEGVMGDTPREVRRGVAEGAVAIAVGTQALAGMAFARLGLAVIDEEQRFGEAQKEALVAAAAHRLVMTATPIPRTMQSALVGLREVSVIATAPIQRQATRSFVLEWDPVLVQEALQREHARGGQSFVVCPRVGDLAPMRERLAELRPRLEVVEAHGRMRAEALEAAVVGFAAGHGDVLLATNIIESGLDIPRANTIVVMHADRFGLAQLHQLRGRVGRGARRGTAYLLTEPGRRLAAPTRARLHALEALGSLGAGFAISAADLDHRGAGELFGAAQAGHVSALGTDLYHHLLHRALDARRGVAAGGEATVLHVELAGRLPAEMVPEADLRISLYRRLARFTTVAEIDDFAEELHDRFGALAAEAEVLLMLARLRCLAAGAGIARVDAGPRGVAVTPASEEGLGVLAGRLGGVVRDGRLLLAIQEGDARARVGQLIEVLSAGG